jgi:hypothetical protein
MAYRAPERDHDLHVTVIGARSLKDVESVGKQDPYCLIACGPHMNRTPTHEDGGTAPTWNHSLTFDVAPTEFLILSVKVRVARRRGASCLRAVACMCAECQFGRRPQRRVVSCRGRTV